MLVTVLFGLAGLIVILVIVVALQPADFRISRSATVTAAPAVVFDRVNNFRNWEDWSPWAKIDPACKKTYDGPASGEGAKYAWSGDNKVGQGNMTLTQSRPTGLVKIDIHFIRPFKATNTVEFTFVPSGEGTLVTWNMFGKKNFMSKAFGLIVNMDQLVGKDFEKGLAQLQAVTAGSPSS